MAAFSHRLRTLAPGQYEIVEVQTRRGITRALLFPKALLRAEWEANAPLPEALAIKRERLQAKREERKSGLHNRPTNPMERSTLSGLISVRHGTTRLVVCIGPYALKIAKGKRGRICNLYESALWKRTTKVRRQMLCPVLAMMPLGIVLLMPRAQPLTEQEKSSLIETDGFPDWDYVPPDEGHPFEYKASDWGRLDGRLVALDYSAPAL